MIAISLLIVAQFIGFTSFGFNCGQEVKLVWISNPVRLHNWTLCFSHIVILMKFSCVLAA